MDKKLSCVSGNNPYRKNERGVEMGESERIPTSSIDDLSFKENLYSAEQIKEQINQHYQGNYFKGVNFDPYLVARIFKMNGGPLEHIMKKCLRGTNKGHTEEQILKEIICAAERGIEIMKIMDEDKPEVGCKHDDVSVYPKCYLPDKAEGVICDICGSLLNIDDYSILADSSGLLIAVVAPDEI